MAYMGLAILIGWWDLVEFGLSMYEVLGSVGLLSVLGIFILSYIQGLRDRVEELEGENRSLQFRLSFVRRRSCDKSRIIEGLQASYHAVRAELKASNSELRKLRGSLRRVYEASIRRSPS